MTGQPIQPGAAFRSRYVEEDVFIFTHPCSIKEGDGLFRRFNRHGAFIEQDWYRFKMDAPHLERVGEWDFCHE